MDYKQDLYLDKKATREEIWKQAKSLIIHVLRKKENAIG